jgi:hypothetical protein
LTNALANLHHAFNHGSRKEFTSILGNKIYMQVYGINTMSRFM